MANIFSRTNDAVAKVPRNTFDGSFQNNLTLQLGGLYPVFCKEVIPGDSFKIDTTFGLRFMPLVFPIQTRMQANLHFFYVRNRNLWKDWVNFIANVDGSLSSDGKSTFVPPTLSLNKDRYDKMLRTGTLGDYLGVPTTITGNYGGMVDLGAIEQGRALPAVPKNVLNESINRIEKIENLLFSITPGAFMPGELTDLALNIEESDMTYTFNTFYNIKPFDMMQGLSDDQFLLLNFTFERDYFSGFQISNTSVLSIVFVAPLDRDGFIGTPLSTREFRIVPTDDVNRVDVQIPKTVMPSAYGFCVFIPVNMAALGRPKAVSDVTGTSDYDPTVFVDSASIAASTDGVRDPNYTSSVFYDKLKLSALPFRAYESIYNAFYRDIRNNPYLLNGKPEYNKYIPSVEGGADTNEYVLRFRNWEPDFLTTAVQSPQQGIAPLVGVSSTGTMKFADESGKVYSAQAEFADDGETITSFKVNSPDMPVGNLRALVDIASSGISINDFRNVNALQRYLETNMRKGLRYKDWIKGHFDVDTSYAELDMPEFIGGISKPIMVNQVTSTASTDMDTLGDYAGQASCMGSGNSISRYFDEHGFVIGILSVSPVPNYSQLLPKMFLRDNPLDYYTPEFGHIGYQPITYKEVCPLQTFQSKDSLDDVFGYQRAWYDYIANVDEVHGQFRDTLQDFLINRYFDVRPELSEQFLLIDPETVNKPFKYSDKVNQPILGQLWFDVKMKRPIPQLGIPRLE